MREFLENLFHEYNKAYEERKEILAKRPNGVTNIEHIFCKYNHGKIGK